MGTVDQGTPGRLPESALRAHAGFVQALARALTGAPDSADDVEQKTWMAALERPPADPAGLRGWLATVVRNLALRQRRDAGRRERGRRRMPEAAAFPAPDAILERRETLGRVTEAVMALEEPYLGTVLLRFYEGYPPREIARRLGVPVTTVKSRLKRALAQLRTSLDQRCGGDRRRWSLALAAFARPEGGMAAAAAGGSVIPGILIMTTKLRLALAAGLLLLLGTAGLWLLPERETPAPGDVTLTGSGDPTGGAARPGDRAHGADPADPIAVRPYAELDDEEPEAEEPRTGSLLVRVVWPDGTPAAGVPVEITWTTREPMTRRHKLVETTSADGSILMRDVEPKKLGAVTELGGHTVGEVWAGKRTELTLEIPPGPAVELEVVDGSGVPVAGAEVVHVHGSRRGRAPRTIGRTDASGRFRLRATMRDAQVGIIADGYRRSELEGVEGDPGEVQHLRFVLHRGGATLAGRVLDGHGHPVAAAPVRVGDPAWPLSRWLNPSDRDVSRSTVLVETDAEGRFRVAGLAPGETPVTVQPRDGAWARWTGTVALEDGRGTELSVRLEDAATLRGVVRDGRGRPLAGVHVSAMQWEQDFGNAQMPTAEDGSFELTGLPAGEVVARVGQIEERIQLRPGEVGRWDPVLEGAAGVIWGSVLDAAGQPLAGWRVEVLADGAWYGRDTTIPTGDDGGFRFLGVPEGPVCVQVRSQQVYGGRWPAAQKDGVYAGEEVVFRIGPVPEAWIEGRLLAPDGRAAPWGEVVLWDRPQNHGRTSKADAATGGFRLGPMPPGTYELVAEAPGLGKLELGTWTVEADQTLDVGPHRFGVPGRVVVELAYPDGVPRADAHLNIGRLDGPGSIQLRLDGQPARVERSVAAGRYQVQVFAFEGAIWLDRVEDLEVGHGAEVAVKLELARFRTVVVRVVEPEGSGAAESAAVVVKRDEEVVAEATAVRGARGALEAAVRLDAWQGFYQVSVRTADGLEGRGLIDAQGPGRVAEVRVSEQ